MMASAIGRKMSAAASRMAGSTSPPVCRPARQHQADGLGRFLRPGPIDPAGCNGNCDAAPNEHELITMPPITAGSCLCGTVQFQVSGAFESFFLCHCKRCRKDTGSAHAANLFSSKARLNWLAGQDSIRTYRLPETRHEKASAFCVDQRFRLFNLRGPWWSSRPGASIARSTSRQMRISALPAGRNGTRIWKTYPR